MHEHMVLVRVYNALSLYRNPLNIGVCFVSLIVAGVIRTLAPIYS